MLFGYFQDGSVRSAVNWYRQKHPGEPEVFFGGTKRNKKPSGTSDFFSNTRLHALSTPFPLPEFFPPISFSSSTQLRVCLLKTRGFVHFIAK